MQVSTNSIQKKYMALKKKKVTAYNTRSIWGRRKKKIFLSSATNLRFVVFQFCYRKGPHPQENFQRLVCLFIKKKNKMHCFNGLFLNKTAPNHTSTHLWCTVSYFILLPPFLLPCEVHTLSCHLLLDLLMP